MTQIPPIEPLTTPEFKRMLQQCIHCGLCLEACPTYSVFGTEMDAPRGRIAMMHAASSGRIGLTDSFQDHITLCLACRACETACPSGVQYGNLVEVVRNTIEKQRSPGLFESLLRWLSLRQLLPRLGRLRLVARVVRFYQVSGLQRLVHTLNFLPSRLKMMENLLPTISTNYPNYRNPAPPLGTKRGIVAFFHGCVQDAFLARVNNASIRVLQRNGFEVHFPRQQTCCGAAHLHLGEQALAEDLARRNIDAFIDESNLINGDDGTGFVAIINNAGGCGTTLKDYAHLLHDDPTYADKARSFVAKVQDISEFLDKHLIVKPQGELQIRATYADSCHLRHAQKIIQQPRNLLESIPGLQLIELDKPDRCCGSAGVYNLLQPETANAILSDKMEDIAATGADTIVTTNAGCYFQLLHGVKQTHSSARVVHLVELLEESYAAQAGEDTTQKLNV
jgi:glycolate oxidase iron-sulfur subunit